MSKDLEQAYIDLEQAFDEYALLLEEHRLTPIEEYYDILTKNQEALERALFNVQNLKNRE